MIRLLPSRSAAVVLVPLLALGACNSSSTPQASSTASGEILPGSISDAMLDTDRSQAQAPLAPAAHSAAAKVDAGASADASDAAADPAAAPILPQQTRFLPDPRLRQRPKRPTPEPTPLLIEAEQRSGLAQVRLIQHPSVQLQRTHSGIRHKGIDNGPRIGEFFLAGRESSVDQRHL